MDNKPQSTAKDFFLCLGVAVGLYVSTVSFLVLVFSIINKVLPLVGEYISNTPDQTIRSSIAALIIFLPAFLYITYITNKDLIQNPEKKDYWMRKWMIFFTLFVTGLTIAIDLVTLVYRFLGAEDLSLHFFLKIFFVLLVALVVFRSSLSDLKRTTFNYDAQTKMKGGAIIIVVLGVIIYGVILIGSPMQQKAKQMDGQRIDDLMSIQNQIVYTQWQNKGDIPTSTSALNDPISNYVVPTDPETKAPYEYIRLSKNSFQLCAVFETTNRTSTIGTTTKYNIEPTTLTENWQHDTGRFCFERTIESDNVQSSSCKYSPRSGKINTKGGPFGTAFCMLIAISQKLTEVL